MIHEALEAYHRERVLCVAGSARCGRLPAVPPMLSMSELASVKRALRHVEARAIEHADDGKDCNCLQFRVVPQGPRISKKTYG